MSPGHHAAKSPGLKNLVLSLLSGTLLILSFPKFNLWLLAWFGFVPLFFALEGKSKAKAFLLAYLAGVVFWFGTIYWLIHVTLPGMIILALYLALYFGIFGLIISRYTLYAIRSTLLLPSLWVILEYLRSHLLTGFPWALLGYSQYLNLPAIQISDMAGAWGVSFMVMLANAAIYSVARCPLPVKKQKFIPLLFIMIFVLIYGYSKLAQANKQTGKQATIRISVIQANIPQRLKWNIEARDFIVDKYLTLTKEALKDRPDFVIWPEACLPVVLEEAPAYYEKVKDFVREERVPLVLGAVTAEKDAYYNSALLLSAEGNLLKKYNKVHLVPFGEYIPLRKTLRFLERVVPIGDFTAGREYAVFGSPVNFSVLICFEDLFPELSRQFVRRGAGFLVNITNDAWFGRTSSPYQHLQASVFRAVENRVNVVRSANTGVSGFIAPSGKILSLVQDASGRNIFITGHKTEGITIAQGRLSFYTRYGDIFIILCFLFLLYGIIRNLKRRAF